MIGRNTKKTFPLDTPGNHNVHSFDPIVDPLFLDPVV